MNGRMNDVAFDKPRQGYLGDDRLDRILLVLQDRLESVHSHARLVVDNRHSLLVDIHGDVADALDRSERGRDGVLAVLARDIWNIENGPCHAFSPLQFCQCTPAPPRASISAASPTARATRPIAAR